MKPWVSPEKCANEKCNRKRKGSGDFFCTQRCAVEYANTRALAVAQARHDAKFSWALELKWVSGSPSLTADGDAPDEVLEAVAMIQDMLENEGWHQPKEVCIENVDWETQAGESKDWIHVDDMAEIVDARLEILVEAFHRQYHDHFGVHVCTPCQDLIHRAEEAA